MNVFVKFLVSLVNGILGALIWAYILISGTAVVHALLVIFGSARHMGRSRGGLFGMMQYQSTFNNPLRGYHIDSGLLKILLVIALLIGIGIIIRSFKTSGIKQLCIFNLWALANNMAGAVLITAATKWVLDKDSVTAMTLLFVGIGISFGGKLIEKWFLRETRTSLSSHQEISDI